MSENRIAASSAMRRSGCSVTSAASSGVLHSSRKSCLSAQRPVLGQVAAGLAHEPDGRAVDGLAAAGAEEAVVGGVGTGRVGHDDKRTGVSRNEPALH